MSSTLDPAQLPDPALPEPTRIGSPSSLSFNDSPHPERCIAATFSLYSSTVFPRYQVEWTDPLSLQPPSLLPPPPRLTENGASLCFYSSSAPPLKSNTRLLSCYLVISLYSPTRCHTTPTGAQQTPKALPLIHGTAADNDGSREERVGG